MRKNDQYWPRKKIKTDKKIAKIGQEKKQQNAINNTKIFSNKMRTRRKLEGLRG